MTEPDDGAPAAAVPDPEAVADAPATGTDAAPPANEAEEVAALPAWRRAINALKVPVLAVVTALIIGAIVLVFTDPDTLGRWANFQANPSAAFTDSWELVSNAYEALFRGAFGSTSAISETLVAATPLILAGLSVGFAFRAGLFNIGGSGQVLMGSMAAAYVGFTFELPGGVHVLAALVAGMVAGAIWGGIVGVLKARTGAHEVITSIMLNYIALHLVDYLLGTEPFLRPGRSDPITPPVLSSAELPRFLGQQYRLHAGIILALLIAALVWWVLFRSTLGFRLRSVGLNPNAATYAGMGVAATWVTAMLISGALTGLAGAIQVLGVQKSISGGLPTVGFDAIALALLGRAHPAGIVIAAILFGALTAGGQQMQGATGTPIDMITVIQALIIMFIAAPALIKALWRVRDPGVGAQTLAAGWG